MEEEEKEEMRKRKIRRGAGRGRGRRGGWKMIGERIKQRRERKKKKF